MREMHDRLALSAMVLEDPFSVRKAVDVTPLGQSEKREIIVRHS